MLGTANQRGLSLAELMISLVVSSFIVLAAATHYTITYRASLSAQLSSARTDQFTRIEFLLTSAIREAGFLDSLANVTNRLETTADYNPSTTPSAVADAATIKPSENDNCVIIESATDSNPVYEYGFRINGGVVQSASGDEVKCDEGTWSPLTTIESLRFIDLKVTPGGDDEYINADSPVLAPLQDSNECFGDERENNCMVNQLWQLTLCALPPEGSTVNPSCNDDVTSYYSQTLIAPRNPLLTGATE